MSTKELDWAEGLSKLKQKAVSQIQTAEVLGISSRRVRRLYKGYKELGAKAIISKKKRGSRQPPITPGINGLLPLLKTIIKSLCHFCP